LLRHARYDMVLISASEGVPLESCRALTDIVKEATASPPRVVLGGTILSGSPLSIQQIGFQTGADLVTDDPNEVIAACVLCDQIGLPSPTKAATRLRQG